MAFTILASSEKHFFHAIVYANLRTFSINVTDYKKTFIFT